MTRPDWLDPDEYPFESRFMELSAGRMHYLDEGAGSPLVMVHGTPEWSFGYRHLIKDLAAGYRCIVPDHLGFGLSEHPVGYPYTPEHQARTLEVFLERLDVDEMTLLLHDFGGPFGFHFALRHPERVRRLVVLNTWMWSLRGDRRFELFDRLFRSPLGGLLYLNLNLSPRLIMPSAMADRRSLPAEVHRHYLAPFPTPQSRRPLLAYARSLLASSGWFDGLWQRRKALHHTPALILWGMKDPAFRPHDLERLETVFADATTVRLDTVGHFPQEEAPGEILPHIRDFLADGSPGERTDQVRS